MAELNYPVCFNTNATYSPVAPTKGATIESFDSSARDLLAFDFQEEICATTVCAFETVVTTSTRTEAGS